MSLEATFRPIDAWPGQKTVYPRRSQFKASEGDTLWLLKHELEQLDARHIVIQVALREDQIRQDGWPRAGVTPTHPGVIVAFDSKYGPLKYATDVFDRYRDNLRAIALGLEALRKVDRYGITKRGEQYTGWKQIGSGEDDALERGRALIREHGSVKAALKAAHPDTGGDREDFEAIQKAREVDGDG